MRTTHKLLFRNSNNLQSIQNESVDLMLTSPPYPMISMWDEMFSAQNHQIKEAIAQENGGLAFELMHKELDKIWDEVYRVLKEGGFACINIGDATRTLGGCFQLFNSHTRIIQHCTQKGFITLPAIIWRKQTNAPNKFMGSGMLPAGAYVTLEHEYILILRKGQRRSFNSEHSKIKRQESSYFWEERNIWFSDVWTDLHGTKQALNRQGLRERSGAFPFELAYRLINMFSIKEDTVLDPFLGTGTTILASMASERNSIGVEIDKGFLPTIKENINHSKSGINTYIDERLQKHIIFAKNREEERGPLKYRNIHHLFPVMTKQELGLSFRKIEEVIYNNEQFLVRYKDIPAFDNPRIDISLNSFIQKSNETLIPSFNFS